MNDRQPTPTCAACQGAPIRVLPSGRISACSACTGTPIGVTVEGLEWAAPADPPASQSSLVASLIAANLRLRSDLAVLAAQRDAARGAVQRAAGIHLKAAQEARAAHAEALRWRQQLDHAEAKAEHWQKEAQANLQVAAIQQDEIRDLTARLAEAEVLAKRATA